MSEEEKDKDTRRVLFDNAQSSFDGASPGKDDESNSHTSDGDFDENAEEYEGEDDDDGDDDSLSDEGEDYTNELCGLEKESDMPLEELMALYGYGTTDYFETNSQPESPVTEIQEDTHAKNAHLASETNQFRQSLSSIGLKDPVLPLVSKDAPSEGYHSDILKLLDGTKTGELFGDEDEQEDADYKPPAEDSWKKNIRVGPDFQVQVEPVLDECSEEVPYQNKDCLLWDPSLVDQCSVDEFLYDIHRQKHATTSADDLLPSGSHIPDDEKALYLLLQCDCNVQEAIRRHQMQSTPQADSMSLWSEEECREFESGLLVYGKNFYLIQQNQLRSRSIGEIVQFYYLWKATERHDLFVLNNRFEKKRYNLHPTATDYMERFIEELENPSASTASETSGLVSTTSSATGQAPQQTCSQFNPGTVCRPEFQLGQPSALYKETLAQVDAANALQAMEPFRSRHDSHGISLLSSLTNRVHSTDALDVMF